MRIMDKETEKENLHNNIKDDFLALMDMFIQDNPLLMQLVLSSWKLREMNLIDDEELEKIYKGLEKNRDQLKQDFMKEMKAVKRKDMM